MILIGLGANLAHPTHGPPRATLEAALAALSAAGIRVARRSRWYQSAPVPASDQPYFINAVAHLTDPPAPAALLALLHRIEADFGRVRGARNAPRAIDLDLLAYRARVSVPGEVPILPHPRMSERAFVVLPLLDLDRHWRHPVSRLSVAALARRLPPEQWARPLD